MSRSASLVLITATLALPLGCNGCDNELFALPAPKLALAITYLDVDGSSCVEGNINDCAHDFGLLAEGEQRVVNLSLTSVGTDTIAITSISTGRPAPFHLQATPKDLAAG